MPQASDKYSTTTTAEEANTDDYHLVDTDEALDKLISELKQTDSFAFDTETTSIDAMQAELVGLSFAAI
ncbi:MAG: hypothetical protein KAI94_09245, partial [Anaerolineales bacterium]|nr:hypothetical protein [Anaerolineales bacterium]